MSISENKTRSLRGEMYYAFTPELVKERTRCAAAVHKFNNSPNASRRERVELWKK